MAKIFLDDMRALQASAKAEGWEILKVGEDLPAWIEAHGWPEAIDLDYDLREGGRTWDGASVAVWLRDTFTASRRPVSEFPLWDVHSSVPRCNAEMEEILAPYADRRIQGLAPIQRG